MPSENGDLALALHGSFLPVPDASDCSRLQAPISNLAHASTQEGELEINAGREAIALAVTNLGDRPVQVGSHYHFIETNASLKFDRAQAYGKRLDIPAGTAVRFEPGETKTVQLVEIAGDRVIRGGNNLADGPVSDAGQKAALERVAETRFFPSTILTAMPHKMKRRHYAEMFGPTTGDRVRLGDTSLILEVERDFTVYGDECKFGGGKTIREGKGQAAGVGQAEALDCVITNALVVDYTGIYKADIGIKNGLIAGIGKAGNPDVMAGVTRRHDRRRDDRSHRRRRIDSHRRRDGYPHSFHLPATGVRSHRGGTDDDGRRRHRPATGTCATTCTPGRISSANDAASHRCLAAQFRFHRQGQHLSARRIARTNPGRRDRPQAARRLGHHARRD